MTAIFTFFVPAHFQSLLFFRKFFCYFVKFMPKILLLFIAADVMMLLVFAQCLCIAAPCNFAIQIHTAASNLSFSRHPPYYLCSGSPETLGPLVSIRTFINHLNWRSSEFVQLFKRFNWFLAKQLNRFRKIKTKLQ